VDRLGVQVALLLLLAAAAEQAPVLVSVDDVQWLDVESRDALLFAARRLDSDAVGMLFAVRTGQPVGCQKSAWPVSCSDDQGQS
jgi:hypothetical protein